MAKYVARCEDRIHFDVTFDDADLEDGETLEDLVGRVVATKRMTARLGLYDIESIVRVADLGKEEP